jgi:hypothetical protein
MGFTGRDSISSTISDYELPTCPNAYFPFPESIGESLGFTSEELSAQHPGKALTSESTVSADILDPLPSPVPSLPLDYTFPVTPPRFPRRNSVATQSPCMSPDGHLRPPVASPVRSHGRTRPVKAPGSRSLSIDSPSGYPDVRSIPTTNFSASSGIMTSVLIPMTAPRYDPELERDLEEYSLGVESVAHLEGGPSMSSFQISQPSRKPTPNGKDKARAVRGQNLEDGDLDLNAEFDFEAEFGDIIDIHATRARSSTA